MKTVGTLQAICEHWKKPVPREAFFAAVESEECIRLLMLYPHEELTGLIHELIRAANYDLA
jgi:hypothetical protein